MGIRIEMWHPRAQLLSASTERLHYFRRATCQIGAHGNHYLRAPGEGRRVCAAAQSASGKAVLKGRPSDQERDQRAPKPAGLVKEREVAGLLSGWLRRLPAQ